MSVTNRDATREEYIRALGVYKGAMQMREHVRAAMDELVQSLGDAAFEAGNRAFETLSREEG
jgi:hypothetical protein